MRIILFYHSLISDWNHGNAHFLRGVVSELLARDHAVYVYEPHNAWSVQNLLKEHGTAPLHEFAQVYPQLRSQRYDLVQLDLDQALDHADLVIVHEWNDHELVRRVGQHHASNGKYVLLFHDTHHRAATDESSMAAYDLRHYDGVLAFGAVVRDVYLRKSWTHRAWTWHEAADTRRFKPQPEITPNGDLVWVGNWGDDERTAELHEFLLQPVQQLGLRARVHGVRYPDHALAALQNAGIEYAGWLPNYAVPQTFARFRVTVHVMRRPYVQALPGIPTIRVFEALACGIPLVCSPWDDVEGLFTPDHDFLIAHNGATMTHHVQRILADPEHAQELAAHGLATIRARHTCAHRVDELLAIVDEIKQANEAAEIRNREAGM